MACNWKKLGVGGGGVALMIWPIRGCASGPVMDFDLFA